MVTADGKWLGGLVLKQDYPLLRFRYSKKSMRCVYRVDGGVTPKVGFRAVVSELHSLISRHRTR